MRIPGSKADTSKEQVQVLSNEPVKDVVLSVPVVVGATIGAEGFDNGVDRNAVPIDLIAPVIADATAKGRQDVPEGPPPKKIRTFRIINPGGKTVNDPHGSGRVHLHEGKEITTAHHDIRALQKQGVRLDEVTDLSPTDVAPIYVD